MESNAKNPFNWIEIYVEDMSRAQQFYETVFDIKMVELPIPKEMVEMQMLSFPWVENERNISGALVKTKQMKPGTGRTLVYFTCDDCSVEEVRAAKSGGKILKSKIPIGNHGFCSIVTDTEGNSIGLHSLK